jgi:hypothetical protein
MRFTKSSTPRTEPYAIAPLALEFLSTVSLCERLCGAATLTTPAAAVREFDTPALPGSAEAFDFRKRPRTAGGVVTRHAGNVAATHRRMR